MSQSLPPSKLIPIGDLKPNPDNPRVIKDDKFKKLVASIREFPEMLALRPIVVNADRVVLGGNMRLKACQAAKLKEVPVIVADALTPDQQREFIIKDNVGFGEWDWDELANAWDAQQLTDWGLDVPDFGTAPANGNTDPDEVPEPPVEPISKPGDLWVLGPHRVACGDSTDATVWDRVMLSGEQASIIWTDPPYGVNHIGGTKDPRRPTHRSGGVVNNDEKTGDDLVRLIADAVSIIPRTSTAVCYMASPGGANLRDLIDAYNQSGFSFRHTLVWVKSAFVFGRADYHYQHEMILYGWADTHEWAGPRNLSTVFDFARGDKSIAHPTSKPVGLVLATASNHPGDIMVDPFLGSGTTLMAATQLQRVCRGVELDPRYVDVIVKRWEEFTGQKAVHAETGKPFGAID